LTALIASRVDTFQPVFKETSHVSTSRPAEVRGMAATSAAVHGIRLPASTFCDRVGVSVAAFHYWRQRLGQEQSELSVGA